MRGLQPGLILTGQHPSLTPAEHRLDEFSTVHLNCPEESNPDGHVERVAAAMAPLLRQRPDLLIVQGGTSSALGGALAAFASGTKLAHVEAGLRTHDSRLPWPEEGYRTRIDARADLLLAPTELASANLQREGVPGAIHVTGNTGVDALLSVIAELPSAQRVSEARRVLVTCHRCESWGEGLRSIVSAVREVAADDSAAIDVVLHPKPTSPRLCAKRSTLSRTSRCSSRVATAS